MGPSGERFHGERPYSAQVDILPCQAIGERPDASMSMRFEPKVDGRSEVKSSYAEMCDD